MFIYFSVGRKYLIFLVINFTDIKGFTRFLSYVKDEFKVSVKNVFIFFYLFVNIFHIPFDFPGLIVFVKISSSCYDLYSVKDGRFT